MTFSGPVEPEILRSASTAEIAVILLRQLGSSPNAHNLMVFAKQGYASEPDARELSGRVSDAYAWLEAHACIGPSESGGSWMRLTAAGRELLASDSSLAKIFAADRLQGNLLPALEQSARPNFDRGDYETASFAALKSVEVEVRRLSGLSPGLVGTKLMQEAFKPGGPLNDVNAEGGEQVALLELFKGAIGTFKNPASHRVVEFDDPLEAAEVVQFADLLLRILKRTERRLKADD